MDQEKIGKFIASLRKEKGFTQAVLAEKLGITDRAVSKWENGRSLPDASIMLELCGLLDINVNELLSGERIAMENYEQIAEQTIVEMKKQEEHKNKKLLTAESVIVAISAVSSFVIILAGLLLAPYRPTVGVILCYAGTALALCGTIYATTLEHDAGYYECPNCGNRYVPAMSEVIFAVHYGSTRKLRCPCCGKKGYNKKVLTK
ncbi:MAG: helix-turn-helix transcriptional regulator [Ruminococcus sp.]|nr:helix-turn-helix transcriptional regulator [Ruminococcus sp.]